MMIQHVQLAAALSVLSGIVTPLLATVFTKEHVAPKVQTILNAVLAAIAGGVSAAVQVGGSVSWETIVVDIGLAYAVSTTAFNGIWKPTGVAPKLSRLTAGFGIGTPVPAAA